MSSIEARNFDASDDSLGENAQVTPTVNALIKYSEGNILQRAAANYFFTRNPERSEKLWRFLGAPLVRKVVMSYGRYGSRTGTHYRIDASKPRIEGAMRFAVGGSVANEIIHSIGFIGNALGFFSGAAINDPRMEALNLTFLAVNAGAVVLQRWNRARMLIRVNEELAQGHTFDPAYENWLGVDAGAVNNFNQAYSQKLVGDEPIWEQQTQPLRAIRNGAEAP